MDASSSKGSLLSDANSAPPVQNEPVMQENQHNDKTAKEKQLAAAKTRLDTLPMLKILSIMRKALPEDANLDADVDLVMRTCVAKFTGYLISEAKEQKTLAKHRKLQSEDIISALKILGFKDASAALSLFYSRFTGTTNCSQPQQLKPVHISEPTSTDVQQKGRVNDSTEEPNIGSTDVKSPVHNSEPHQSPVHNSEPNQSPVHNSEPNQSPLHNSEMHQSPVHNSEPHQSPVHNSEPLLTEMEQLKGGIDVPRESALGPNEESSTGGARVELPVHAPEILSTEMQQHGTNVQLPVHSVDQFLSGMQWQSSVNVPAEENYRHFEGNATMLPPPSPSFESLPQSIVQSLLVQQNQQERTMSDRVVRLMVQNPDTTPYLVNMQPPSAPVRQDESVQGGALDANPHLSNAHSSQMMARSDAEFAQPVPKQAEAFNASPVTQPMNQPAFPGSTLFADQQQNGGGDGTTMAIDEIPGTRAGSSSGADFDAMMSDADLADAIKLLKEYGVYSDVP